jgi:hypothetical protein
MEVSFSADQLLIKALEQLQWISPACGELLPRATFTENGSNACWFSRVLEVDRRLPRILTAEGRKHLRSIVQLGVCLLDRWPFAEGDIGERWVGRRFYLSAAENFQASLRYCSICSSRIGRGGSGLPNWPHLLDWALRMIRRDRLSVLAIPGTALYRLTMDFCSVANVPAVEIVLPPERRSPRSGRPESKRLDQRPGAAEWLIDRLRSLAQGDQPHQWKSRIEVSPEWSPARNESALNDGTDLGDSQTVARTPIQDRLAIFLPERVWVFSVRPRGNIAQLLEQRLSDPGFSEGRVFVAFPATGNESRHCPQAYLSHLMDRGAVGWLVSHPSVPEEPEFQHCLRSGWALVSADDCLSRDPARSSRPEMPGGSCPASSTYQMCAPVDRMWSQTQDAWSFLTHCTRGNQGRLPHESEGGYLRRLWLRGAVPAISPLMTLVRILDDGRLRGTTWLTHGIQPSVSLTEVPLQDLLHRRKFRSHLGRWDWEPYGLLFRREDLPSARRVTYAPRSELERISSADREYFHPMDSKVDWSQEREWRVMGDLDLCSLPMGSVTVFVRSRSEALQLARFSPFPVIWTQSDHH